MNLLALISPKTGTELTVGNLFIPSGDLQYDLLIALDGFFWALAYVLIIHRSVKDKTCGMPAAVLCLSFTWEFVFGFLGAPLVEAGSFFDLSRQPLAMRIHNVVWFVLDCGILYTLLRYGRDEYEKFHPGAPKKAFVPLVLTGLAVCFIGMVVSVYEWGDHNGIYAAYIDNVLISLLFIRMLYRRGNADGQSMWIGLSKCLGTIATFLLGGAVVRREFGVGKRIFFDMEFLPLMKLCILLILILDIAYLIILYRTMKHKLHLNPWTRKPLKVNK